MESGAIGRGTTIGAVGYTDGFPHVFDIIYTSNGIIVIVDGTLEIVEVDDYSGITGRLGFYDFSHASTTWNEVFMMDIVDLEGCSSGFWKNDADKRGAGNWPIGTLPSDDFEDELDVDGILPNLRIKGSGDPAEPTIFEALNAKSGKINALAREVAASLLNIRSGTVDYPIDEATLEDKFDDVLPNDQEGIEELRAFLFDLNHATCPDFPPPI